MLDSPSNTFSSSSIFPSSLRTSPLVGMFMLESAVWTPFSIVPFASSAALTVFCSAPISFSLERSCEANLLMRSSPVAIIFFSTGFSRSMGQGS